MTQAILIVALELLGDFGALVDRAHRCLILTRMFIVSVIVIIFGATRRRARGESIPETGARCVVLGVWWSCKDPHKHNGEPSYFGPLGEYPPM